MTSRILPKYLRSDMVIFSLCCALVSLDTPPRDTAGGEEKKIFKFETPASGVKNA